MSFDRGRWNPQAKPRRLQEDRQVDRVCNPTTLLRTMLTEAGIRLFPGCAGNSWDTPSQGKRQEKKLVEKRSNEALEDIALAGTSSHSWAVLGMDRPLLPEGLHKKAEKKVTCSLAKCNLFKTAARKIPWMWISACLFWHISSHVPSADAFCGAAGNFLTGGAEDAQALRGGSQEMLTSSNGCITLCIYTVRKALTQAGFIPPSYRHLIKALKQHG